MKEVFVGHRFSEKAAGLIAKCNDVIARYLAQGLRLTLRQLYYQLVTQNIIPNIERSYKNLSSVLSDARLAGLVDWDAIEDRVRVPRHPPEFADLGELVDAALASFRLPRWADQPHYCELWVEKDALSGVLAPLAREHHVVLSVNRGYSSQSAMYEAAKRFIAHASCEEGCVLLYCGDHDPSGEDMVRDIRDRMRTFGADVEVRKLALTMEQVEQYHPPPNPAKMTDPRATEYVAKHGDESWEVDALPPEALQKLIRRSIMALIDQDKLQDILDREETDKATLRKALEAVKRKR
jgi:hypothetical protein